MSLEDKILKRNIPGRHMSWDFQVGNEVPDEEDEDSTHSFESPCASELLNDDGCYQVPPSPCRPRNRTGVKGVLADYKREKQNQEYIQVLEDVDKQRLLEPRAMLNMISDTVLPSKHESGNDEHNEISSDDDDYEYNQDEFLKNYHEMRLLELQQNKGWPIFGKVKDVNAIEFAEIVDDQDPRVFCVIHLYEQHIPDCRLLDSHLSQLAQRMPSCCFLRLKATAAKRDLDLIALPSVLIYRNRILVANLTPITASLGNTYHHVDRRHSSFTMDDIQNILQSYGVHDPNNNSSTDLHP